MSFEQELVASGQARMPRDFWSFWDARLAGAPASAPAARDAGLASPVAVYEELCLAAPDGQALRARCVRPRNIAGPVPCVLASYDAGRGPRGWHHLTRWVALGFAVVQPERRRWSGDVTGGWEQGPAGLELAQQVEDAARWLVALPALSFVDAGRLAIWGEGLGAGLVLAAAALAARQGVEVRRACLLNPVPADFRAVWQASGCEGPYEGLRSHFRIQDPTGSAAEGLFGALDYVDGANFASGLGADLLLGTSLMDTVSPPAAQSTLWEAVPGTAKRRVTYPKWGHERVNDFEDKSLGWLVDL